jgi:predicted nucleotidyltransferase component of viral defense system
MANVVVAQMLPTSAVKGGTSLNLRRGPGASRFSPDLDASRPRDESESDFLDKLEENLKHGWNGFRGTMTQRPKASPKSVPPQYVMQPLNVNVTYNNSTFAKVTLELAFDELGSVEEATEVIADEIVELFTGVGLGAPSAVAVLSTEHQVVQKLHACTTLSLRGTNERAHDLVDIQLLCEGEEIDFTEIDALGRRLFAYRKKEEWPPTVIAHDGWETLYVEASEGLDVLPLAEAIVWINSLVDKAVSEGSTVIRDV